MPSMGPDYSIDSMHAGGSRVQHTVEDGTARLHHCQNPTPTSPQPRYTLVPPLPQFPTTRSCPFAPSLLPPMKARLIGVE